METHPSTPALQRTLRRLILVEIAVTSVLLGIGFFGEPFLPAPLQSYLDAQASAPLTSLDSLILPMDLLFLVLSVIAWVGLWRGWRRSRGLYTWLWIISLPLILAHGPDVASGVSQCLATTGTLVGGLIMGLLYFSELRHRYEDHRPG
ncbi:MAG TPA: hypothetical protein VF585_10965 [Chthoniobacterales bacterium]|jgi:hypothetical protein